LQIIMEESGGRAEVWQAAVTTEDWRRGTQRLKIKRLKIKSLWDRGPLSARGTLPHREIPRY
jgi:hypothetical protein